MVSGYRLHSDTSHTPKPIPDIEEANPIGSSGKDRNPIDMIAPSDPPIIPPSSMAIVLLPYQPNARSLFFRLQLTFGSLANSVQQCVSVA